MSDTTIAPRKPYPTHHLCVSANFASIPATGAKDV
jgi:hypothetical protein